MNFNEYLYYFKSKYAFREEFKDMVVDAEHIRKEMGYEDINHLTGMLLRLNRFKHQQIIKEQELLDEKNKEIQKLKQEIIRMEQEYKLKASRRIDTRKKNINVYEVAVHLNLKRPDKEIMEKFGISRSTLWRIKKDIEKQGGVQVVLQNIFL